MTQLTGICSWCGAPATCVVLESETCDACKQGGRQYRIDRYQERLQRSATKKHAG